MSLEILTIEMTITFSMNRAITKAINGMNRLTALSLTKAAIYLTLVDKLQVLTTVSLHRGFHPRILGIIQKLPLGFDISHHASIG